MFRMLFTPEPLLEGISSSSGTRLARFSATWTESVRECSLSNSFEPTAKCPFAMISDTVARSFHK